MQRYNPKDIEQKWQKHWADQGLYKAVDFDERQKFVMLTEFPYPSGDGLHLGHTREYTLGDIIARHKRMQGMNVLYPMGYDAFGLPTENYAIKNKIPPQVATDRNVANFQKQFESLGLSIDWSRSFRTTDPDYYKWTQWLFLQFFKTGLAYQEETAINWCPHCKTGLANEEVVNGRHERCDTIVEKKLLKQWLLKITQYADRLIDGLKDVDYPSRIADQQVNWIGRSKGAEIDFAVDEDLGEQDFVLLHGYKGSSQLDFFPWLKQALEARGAKVFAPDLPDTEAPNIAKQVQFLLENHTFSEKTVLVTHSLGGVDAMKLLPQLKTKVASLIMFAPPLRTVFKDNKQRPALEAACDWQFDFAAVREKAHSITVVADNGDDVVLPDQPQEIAEKLGARFVAVTANSPHFNAQEEPSVLETVVPSIKVFTTRADTLFGATFMVLAPEHPLVEKITTPEQRPHVNSYVKMAQAKTDVERQEATREKTGVATGAHAVNPANGEKIPVWIADYVLMGYGTGAIMAVPAHDERDNEFAQKFNLPIVEVVQKPAGFEGCFAGDGAMLHSDEYNGLPNREAREKIVADLAAKGVATEKVNYRLRDWIFSRQHYWGEPIPIIHCPEHGAVPVPDDQLPVVLPEVDHYEPTDTGESPLAEITGWVHTACPVCGGPAKRETDTMPNWAGSSWYYLRYFDAHNDQAFADRKKLEYWGMVDMYLGGMEHTTLHLLYSRFWHEFFYDQGLVPTPEPYRARRGQGIILAADGSKMSKSKGNVINPSEVIDSGYGADALRVAIAFIAPYDQTTPWSPEGVAGTYRFLQRLWTLVQEFQSAAETGGQQPAESKILAVTHRAIKKASGDLDAMNFNTAIAAMMECVNELYKLKEEDHFANKQAWRPALESLLQLLAPFAPHITEELWQQLGNKGSVHVSGWPAYDEKYLVSDTVTIVVQVNGKVRAQLELPAGSDEAAVTAAATADTKVRAYLAGKEVKKSVYVPGKLVNFVI